MTKTNTKQDKTKETKASFKVVCDNRRARYEYEILDTLEVGIELQGTEVKSIRLGKVNLQDAFARIEHGELWLYSCHISPYDFGNRFNHEATRKRKLLAHKNQILKFQQKIKEQSLTLIPLKMIFKRNKVKLEIALARGKKLHDKRDSITNRDTKRQLDRLVKSAIRTR